MWLDGSKPEWVSSSARPVVIRKRCSTSISRRGSTAKRHSGIGAGIEALLGQNSDEGIHHGFGHGEPEQGRIDADPLGITLGDHLALMHHNHRLGSAERWRGRFVEGM